MNQLPSELLDYQSLSAKGLQLAENDFNIIFNAITQGIDDVKLYLNIRDDSGPKLQISATDSTMGFSKEYDVINVNMGYLNLISGNTTPLEYRDQLACFVPDKFYVIFKYLYWLRLFGREEAIHYYQKHGNPKLNVPFPDSFPESLSRKAFILSDLEVEARSTVDAIAELNRENVVWKNVDEYFSHNFSDYYNKPIDHLSTLPKPNIQISFEMENIVA